MITAVPCRRSATGITALLFGAVALVVTQQDFSAARAGFKVDEALAAGDYELAAKRADNAKSRLNPQRGLTSLSRKAEAHIRIARDILDRAIDRQKRSVAGPLPDKQLAQLAHSGFLASAEYCATASEVLSSLAKKSPGHLNSGRLEYRLNLTLARNPGLAQSRDQFIGAATAAAQRELRRQPYNPGVALDVIRIADAESELSLLLTTLARPLRYAKLSRDYVELLSRIAGTRDFDTQFEAIQRVALAAAAAEPPDGPGSTPDDPVATWAPELLRLAATVQFMSGEYEEARALLETAAGAYEKLPGSAPMGAASCYAELADGSFFASPSAPKPALNAALRAIELAPASYDGRTLATNVRLRLVDYYLADGNEDDASRMLRKTTARDVTEEAVVRELGRRYRGLCEALLQRREAGVLRKPLEQLFPKLKAWIGRSLELSPNDPVTHYVAADLEFQDGDDDAVVEHLRTALELGADPEAIARFLTIAQTQRPDSEPLRAFRQKFAPPPEPIVGPMPPGADDPPTGD